jgi:hypothetical protein
MFLPFQRRDGRLGDRATDSPGIIYRALLPKVPWQDDITLDPVYGSAPYTGPQAGPSRFRSCAQGRQSLRRRCFSIHGVIVMVLRSLRTQGVLARAWQVRRAGLSVNSRSPIDVEWRCQGRECADHDYYRTIMGDYYPEISVYDCDPE